MRESLRGNPAWPALWLAALLLTAMPALHAQTPQPAPASPPAAAAPREAAAATADPQLEARVTRLAAELRCLVCQNQTIADSNADLAVDLRRQVREMLGRGASDREVLDYMTARYGDFVLYRPPVRSATALLWFGPTALLVLAVGVLLLVLRRRARMAPERFEPDPEDAA